MRNKLITIGSFSAMAVIIALLIIIVTANIFSGFATDLDMGHSIPILPTCLTDTVRQLDGSCAPQE